MGGQKILAFKIKPEAYFNTRSSTAMNAHAHHEEFFGRKSPDIRGIDSGNKHQGDNIDRPVLRPMTAPAQGFGHGMPEKHSAAEGVYLGGGHLVVPSYRQKGAKKAPPPDAAGRLVGTRYHGRVTPLKGHGLPPPDHHEEARHCHRQWHVQHSHLLQHRDIFGVNEWEGVPAPSTKPSKRVFAMPLAKNYNLRGSGVTVDAQDGPWRKARGWGARPAYSQVNTIERTMGAGAGLKEDDVDPLGSPRKMFSRRVGLDRPTDSPDVIHYRFSKGVCPPEYKLDGRRVPAPQVTPKLGEFSSKVYYDAHTGYQMNRAKGEGLAGILSHKQS